jgi:hypothetical protein
MAWVGGTHRSRSRPNLPLQLLGMCQFLLSGLGIRKPLIDLESGIDLIPKHATHLGLVGCWQQV